MKPNMRNRDPHRENIENMHGMTSKNELLLDILHDTSESVNILVYSVRFLVRGLMG